MAVLSLSRTACLAILAAAVALPALAQDDWPAKPIRLVVPFAAGGTSDVLARALGAQLQTSLKQTVIIDNKAGAGGVIGADSVAKSPADGYTLLLGTIATHAINPALLPKIPYNAAKDFAPVMLLGSISNVLLVGPDQPFKNVKDVVAAAKAKPGSLQFASAGQGTSQHLSGETFKLLAGVEITHVPYKGSAPAIQDVMGGQVPMSFETALVALPQIKAGKVKALAVTSAKRSAVLPEVPTMQEAGIAGFDVASWQALYAPAGTPPAIVNKLNAELAKIIAQPEMKARMDGLGLEYSPNTAEQFAAFQRTEQAKWAKIVKDGNVKVD
ncbi:tripartite tricarboxylate transporter substrate binding protein [uncultured Aquincola sp.]|uniref:tripartite tricarboxylate transporter substrate binding protein n=1 Tax=uncultured Aquincola sp. TaxID=886556 RepID=UPI0032B24118